jgi:AbrB family looped-hinge helix DNA binding protein
MNTVTISNEYQIVIPKEIGDAIGAKPGTRLEVLSYDEKIVLVPIRPMRSMKGAFKGINTEIEREEDRI